MLREIFGIPADEAERFEGALADVVAYFVLTLVRTNPELLRLVNAPTFTFSALKEAVPNYRTAISFVGVMKKLEEVFSAPPGADPELARRVEELMLPILSRFAKGGILDLQKFTKLIPNLLLSIHLQSQGLVSELIETAGISFEQYVDIIEDMHIHKLIGSYNTIHWCENCSLETPLIESSTGRIAPSKLSRKHCMNCDAPMSFSAVYAPSELLKEAFLCKDGFLSVLFGWCLRQEGLDFSFGEYAGDLEMDFVITRAGASTIVEVKTFKNAKDEIAIRSELKGVLTQLDRQVRAMADKGARVDRAFLLWNRTESYDFSGTLTSFEQEHPGVQVRIFNHLEIEKAIKEAKRP